MNTYFEALRAQRWDDHRFYHHSRINQSLHFISAIFFLVSYALLLVDPATAALIAWGISMTTRQAGHFFFEPHDYDQVNHATHQHKEDIKVGYNLRRKIVLMSLWALVPFIIFFSPTLFGLLTPREGFSGYLHNVGLVWLWLGISGVLFRSVGLFFTRDVATGLVWMLKIATDPFHDLKMYWKAPLALIRGELMDPMIHVQKHGRNFSPEDEETATTIP